MRNFYFMDYLIAEVDTALRTLLPPKSRVCERENPSKLIPDTPLSSIRKKHISGLMRVNHSGEICAQALYQGQALTAQLTDIKAHMMNAAKEEIDHLAWCEQRLGELESHTSILNPVWYVGSFLLGAAAGLAGDEISLGFVVETEKQVSLHLQNHLEQLPSEDQKTRIILNQMNEDEMHHAQSAKAAGAIDLPYPVKKLMHSVSKLMTKTSYYW